MGKLSGKTHHRNPLYRALIHSSPIEWFVSRGFRYRKLPPPLLKLSVLKLDGSSFSFHVAKNASISRLKTAIEEESDLSVKDDGHFLWSLVWSHFCLCHENQKLINDKDCIQSYGIKDGDQLYFIQQLRMDCSPRRQESKCSPSPMRVSRLSVDKAHEIDACFIAEDGCCKVKNLECGKEVVPLPAAKSGSDCLVRLLLCSKLPSPERKSLKVD